MHLNWKKKLNFQKPLHSKPFEFFEPEDTKVIFVGDTLDPGNNKLVFSSAPTVMKNHKQKALLNAYSEDLRYPTPRTGDLTSWAVFGALMLSMKDNHKPVFRLLKSFIEGEQPVAFVLLGTEVKQFLGAFNDSKHFMFHSTFPNSYESPYVKHPINQVKLFSSINKHLVSNNVKPMEWKLR